MLKIIVSIIHFSFVSIYVLYLVLFYCGILNTAVIHANHKKYLESLYVLFNFQITANSYQLAQCSVCVGG